MIDELGSGMADYRVVAGVDLGLFSDDPRSIDFYSQDAGLPFVETLQHSPTYQERFYNLGSSSLKINYSTLPMPAGRSGYTGLEIVRADLRDDVELIDPAGLSVRLVRELPGTDAPVAVTCAVHDVDRQARFLVDGLGARAEADGFRLPHTLLRLTGSATQEPAGPTWSRGFKYVVAFVDDIVAAHSDLIGHGADHSVPPLRLGERSAFSWLRDPGGNWLELVQSASVAPLPDLVPIEQRWPEIVAWRETGVAFGG